MSRLRAVLAALLSAGLASTALAAPRSAAEFIASIGVNIHLGATDTGYRDVAAVARHLDFLGVHRVRADLLDIANLAPYRTLGGRGFGLDLIVMVQPNAALPVLRSLAPFTNAIEGPNEVNVTPVAFAGLSGAPAASALQRALYRMVKSDPVLRAIPVLNFTVAQGGSYPQYGDLSAAADFTNVHAYAEHGVPPFWMLRPVMDGVTDTPGRPVMVTEVGNYTMPDGKAGVSEAVQARWLLNTLFDTFRENAVATYVYELLDERADGAVPNSENHYGLFRLDGRPKPAATALHNLTTILKPMPGTRSVTPVEAHIPPLDPPVFHLTLANADGSRDIVIWAEPEIWDNAKRTQRPAPPRSVEIGFSAPVSIAVYDPLIASAALDRQTGVRSAKLAVTDHPVIVHAAP